jgi:hypothetical protein
MKQADEAIDRVLAGLRESEAPVGLEGRILQAMQVRAAAEPVEKPGWWSWSRMAGCGAVLAGLLLVAAVSVPHRAPKAGQEPVVATRVESAPMVTADRAQVDQVQAQSQVQVQAMQAQVHRMGAKGMPAGAAKVNAGSQEPADSNAAEDALAREEMLAPSHPAPPLPMTAQEKLLVQVISRHDPDELAMLNPEEQEKIEAKDEEAFKKFFGIPDAAKPEPQDGTGAKNAPADAKPPEPEAQATALAGK